jgi:3-hydroxyacyl-[acyl-carrier-protein] dehydratase
LGERDGCDGANAVKFSEADVMNAIEKALLKAVTQPPVESDGAITAGFCLPPDFPGFQGHFDGNPICPAVIQARAALLALEQARAARYRLEGMANAKFMSPLGPDQPFTVKLTARADGASFDASLASGGQAVSKIRLTVSPRGEGNE